MRIRYWHILNAIFGIILGITLHFTYELSGFSPTFATFEAVNESIWEHLKLAFWPIFAFMIIEYWGYGKNTGGFFLTRCIGALTSMLFIVSAYYTYTGVVGKNIAIIDILIFLISVICSRMIMLRTIKKMYTVPKVYDYFGLAMMIFIGVLFFWFTFESPNFGMFLAPTV